MSYGCMIIRQTSRYYTSCTVGDLHPPEEYGDPPGPLVTPDCPVGASCCVGTLPGRPGQFVQCTAVSEPETSGIDCYVACHYSAEGY